jgi:cell division protein FtsQ
MRAAAIARGPFVAGARLRTALAPGPRLRRRAAIVLALTALLAGLYLLWLRDSSLVAVERVTVTGLTSDDADRARAALTSTAETMTTLHVDAERLREAVAAFPSIAAIEVVPDFPDGLTVRVVEHRPVALLDADGGRLPVAGDGSILAGVPVEGELPTIELAGPVPDRRLGPGAARDAARAAGAAPPSIARRLETIAHEGAARALVAQVEDGPEIVLGTADRLRAKWAAAVRVLADEEAAGAAYVDVRIPERPVAGGLAAETVAPVEAAEPIIDPAPPVDPALADPALAAPVEGAPQPLPAVPETAAPAPAAPVAPAAPEQGGGATAYPQP